MFTVLRFLLLLFHFLEDYFVANLWIDCINNENSNCYNCGNTEKFFTLYYIVYEVISETIMNVAYPWT